MTEVEGILNSRPLTMMTYSVDDLNPLSPANLLTMRQSVHTAPPGVFQRDDIYMRKRRRNVQYLVGLIWTRFRREYMTTLQQRPKWNDEKSNLKVGDIVLAKNDQAPRCEWPLAKVITVHKDDQGLVRSVTIKTSTSKLDRPIAKLILLLSEEV